jgi:hypothetical protein
MFRLVNVETGKTLVESEEKIAVALFVEERNRVYILANKECIIIYQRARGKERPEIKTIRGRFFLENRMEL